MLKGGALGATSKSPEKGEEGGGLGIPRWEGSTHDVGALGLEGIGATGVQVGGIVGLQEADEVEALGLVVLPFLDTLSLLLRRGLPGDRSLQLQGLHAESKQGLSGPHVQEPSLLRQRQRQEVLDAHLGEPPHYRGQLCRGKRGC